MIVELYIKNCALVEEMSIDFTEGLNILTGETGSGKSIILDALNLCLGGKYDRTFLRKGCSQGMVQLAVSTSGENIRRCLLDMDIDMDDDSIIITRKLYDDGRTAVKINGRNVRVSDLKKAMSLIADMHGQHQNQALYNRENHLEFLDLYGRNSISPYMTSYRKVYEEYNDIKRAINRLNDNKSEMEIERERDLLNFQINEIKAANLSEEEYETLKTQKEVYENSEKIFNSLSESFEILHKGDFNAEDEIGRVFSILGSISSYDKKIGEFEAVSEKIMYELQDLSGSIRNYIESVDFNPGRLNEIQERLDVINNLRRKYGTSISEILTYYDKIVNRLDDIENRREKNEKLLKELDDKTAELREAAFRLSEKRKEVAEKLEKDLLNELKSLNMKNTSFKVRFEEVSFNENGYDDIEFFVSFNLGEDMNPLYKVASGGEMSRFMLAFKSILSDIDRIETMIFDEIDTGISGRAAQIVGEKLAELSKTKQIICITHLPQIASFADSHFYIEKIVENERTYTIMKKLGKDHRKDEIARLISGKVISKTTIQHSEEMLKIADELKN